MDFLIQLMKKKLEQKLAQKLGGGGGEPGLGQGGDTNPGGSNAGGSRGGTGGGNPQVAPIVEVPEAPQAPGADMQGEDIVVQNQPYAKPKYSNPRGLLEAIFPSTFAPDKKAGQIYGIVKDAFLAQAGRPAVSRPLNQQLMEGEALQGLTQDPMRAIEQLMPINPDRATDIYGKVQDDQRLQETAAANAAASRQKYEDTIHKRAGSLIFSATPATYPALRKKYNDYYAAKGIAPAYELPETYDEASLAAAKGFTMDPEDQARMAATREYRDKRLQQGYDFEGGRNRRAQMTDGTRRSEGEANRAVKQSEGDKNREVRLQTSKGRSRPGKVVRVKNPDGTFSYKFQ